MKNEWGDEITINQTKPNEWGDKVAVDSSPADPVKIADRAGRTFDAAQELGISADLLDATFPDRYNPALPPKAPEWLVKGATDLIGSAWNTAIAAPMEAFRSKSGIGGINTMLAMMDEEKKRKEEGLPQQAISESFLTASKKVEQGAQAQAPSVPMEPLTKDTPTAERIARKGLRTIGGVGGFVAQLAVAKKAMGGEAFIDTLAQWEAVNQANGGATGSGALMAATLGGIGMIPSKTLKLGTESGFFMGLGYAQTGDMEEAVIQGLIPFALRAAKVDPAAKNELTPQQQETIVRKYVIDQLPQEKIAEAKQIFLEDSPIGEIGAEAKPTAEKAEPAKPKEPVLTPDTQKTVDLLAAEIERSLKEQKKARNSVEKRYTAKRQENVAKYVALRDKFLAEGSSEAEATAKAKSAHGGSLDPDRPPMPEEALPRLTPEQWNILNRAARETYPEANKAYQHLRAVEAIDKMRKGEVLQNNEIKLLSDVFGVKLGKTLQGQQPLPDRMLRVWHDMTGLLKTMVAGGDISLSIRQLAPVLYQDVGKWIKGTKSKVWSDAILKQVNAYFSDAKYKEYKKEVESNPYYNEAVDHKLQFLEAGEAAEPGLTHESFPSRTAARWPLIKQGERAAVTATNVARMGLYEQVRRLWDNTGVEVTGAKLDKLARLVSDSTGRAMVPGENSRAWRDLIRFTNEIAFSPRFALSRIKNVATLFHTIDADPQIRQQGLDTLRGFVATSAALAVGAAIAGATVDLDPQSADFMKAKKGDTRFDLLAGHGQVIRFMTRMATTKTKTAAGHIEDIDRRDVLARFARSKAAPITNLIIDLYTGRDFFDKKIEGVGGWSKVAYESTVFLWLQDGIDVIANDPSFANILPAAGASAAAWVGVGVQTYPETAKTQETKLKDSYAQAEYGKNFEDLGPRAQKQLTRENKETISEAEKKTKVEGQKRSSFDYVAKLIEEEKAIGKTIHDSLPKDKQIILDGAGVSLGLSRRAGDWIMTDAAYQKYQELVRMELEDRLMEGSDKRIEKIVETAKTKARLQVKREANE